MTIHTAALPLPTHVVPAAFQRSAQDLCLAASVAVVMPCYNEAKRLDVPRILNFLVTHSAVVLILVNDGSTDSTLDLLTAMQAMMPQRITVLDLPCNAGKAEAVRIGLRYALTTQAQLLAYWDADLATPLEAVEDFCRIARRHKQVSVIFGSRRQMLGHQIKRTAGRRVISRLCAGMARMALGLPVADTQCGAKMLRATPALRKAVSQPFTAGWLFDVELFARLVRHLPDPSQAFYEFPLSQWDEIAGSKVTGRAVVRSGFRMLGLIVEARLGLASGRGIGRMKGGEANGAGQSDGGPLTVAPLVGLKIVGGTAS